MPKKKKKTKKISRMKSEAGEDSGQEEHLEENDFSAGDLYKNESEWEEL